MKVYYVPVAVSANSAEDAEQFVERKLDMEAPDFGIEANVDWVGDAEEQETGGS